MPSTLLAHVRAALDGDLDRVAVVAYLRGYVNITPEFDQIAKVVNGASPVMLDVFGPRSAPIAGRPSARPACPSMPQPKLEAEFHLA